VGPRGTVVEAGAIASLPSAGYQAPVGGAGGEGVAGARGPAGREEDGSLVRVVSPRARRKGGETYASAVSRVYRECYRVVRPGGALVLVVGNYVRAGRVVDLAADTVRLARAAGWTPAERWVHAKAAVSFWRRLHHRQGRPVVAEEHVLVFVKGHP